MTPVRLLSLIGIALLVLVLNVALSVLYMVVYSYLINPGHPKEFYEQHIQAAGPYCSIVAGIPLMFVAGLWVGRWWKGQLGIKAGLVVWLAYALIDLGVLLAVGMTGTVAMLFAVSFLTKLAAVYVGGLVAVRKAAAQAPAGHG